MSSQSTIKFKVKTLDGTSHTFEKDAHSTVAELRADLVAKTGIPVDHQRLIFFGRVISAEQDAKQLGELGIEDKVLHVVGRPPTGARPGQNDAPPPPRANTETHNMSVDELRDTIRRLLDEYGPNGRQTQLSLRDRGNFVEVVLQYRSPQANIVDSPARERIVHIGTLMGHINHILWHLENECITQIDEMIASSIIVTENDNSTYTGTNEGGVRTNIDEEYSSLVGTCSRVEHELMRDGTSPHLFAGEADNADVEDARAPLQDRRDGIDPANAPQPPATNNVRIRQTRQPLLARVMRQVRDIQQRMAPVLEVFERAMLHEEQYNSDASAPRGAAMARMFNGVQILVHNMAHMMHVVSDLNIHFAERTPRRIYPQFLSSPVHDDAQAEVIITFQREAGFLHTPIVPTPDLTQPSHAPPEVNDAGTGGDNARLRSPEYPPPHWRNTGPHGLRPQMVPPQHAAGGTMQAMSMQIDVDNGQMRINGQNAGAVDAGNIGGEIMNAINTAGRQAMQHMQTWLQQPPPQQNAQTTVQADADAPVAANGQPTTPNTLTVTVNGRTVTQSVPTRNSQVAANAARSMAAANTLTVNELQQALWQALAQLNIVRPVVLAAQPGGPVDATATGMPARAQQGGPFTARFQGQAPTLMTNRHMQPPTQAEMARMAATAAAHHNLHMRQHQQHMQQHQLQQQQQIQQQHVIIGSTRMGGPGQQQIPNNILMQHGQSQMQFIAAPLAQGPHAGEQMTGALFVGARPPMDMPLYTMDPYLTCASRHFNPVRLHRRMQLNEMERARANANESMDVADTVTPTPDTDEDEGETESPFVHQLRHVV